MLLYVMMLLVPSVQSLFYWTNDTGAYCAAEGRARFVSKRVQPERVYTTNKLKDARGWSSHSLTHIDFPNPTLTGLKITNGIALRQVEPGLNVSWTSGQTEIELEANDAYAFELSSGKSKISLACAKNCRRQNLLLFRDGRKVTILFAGQTGTLSNATDTVRLETTEESLFARVFDLDVLIYDEYEPVPLELHLERGGKACLNYWQAEASSVSATLKIGKSYFPLVEGFGWLSTEVDVGAETTMHLFLSKADVESVTYPDLVLLTSLICGDDLVSTESARGCESNTEKIIMAKNATVCDVKCACGSSCKLCDVGGCGCELRSKVPDCKVVVTTTQAPPISTTTAPALPTWHPVTTSEPKPAIHRGLLTTWMLVVLALIGVTATALVLVCRKRRREEDQVPIVREEEEGVADGQPDGAADGHADDQAGEENGAADRQVDGAVDGQDEQAGVEKEDGLVDKLVEVDLEQNA